MTQMQKIPNPSENFNRIAEFTQTLCIAALPADVTHTAKLLVLDLLGVLAAAGKLEAGRIARDHAVNHWAAGPDAPSARLLFDGRRTSLPGFGFAMGTQLDNLDAHDGWQPSKGHAGAALLPALCAFAEGSASVSGPEALAAMILGYEISYRASDGRVIESGTVEASGGPNPQPTDDEVIKKFRAFAVSVLPEERVSEIESAVMSLDNEHSDFKALLDILSEPGPRL